MPRWQYKMVPHTMHSSTDRARALTSEEVEAAMCDLGLQGYRLLPFMDGYDRLWMERELPNLPE